MLAYKLHMLSSYTYMHVQRIFYIKIMFPIYIYIYIYTYAIYIYIYIYVSVCICIYVMHMFVYIYMYRNVLHLKATVFGFQNIYTRYIQMIWIFFF